MYKRQQLEDVKNNREYDALTKEVEIQNLEIQVCEKKIKEHGFETASKTEIYDQALANIDSRKGDLEIKTGELATITSETEKEEQALTKNADKAETQIEERLLTAYNLSLIHI